MTSPSLISQPAPKAQQDADQPLRRLGVPALLAVITALSTNAVGMRYMHNFLLGRPPLASDADLLPYAWVFHHLGDFAQGLPFSITLLAILLAHEFGHYFACRAFHVRATLPYLLPAPTLSGTFGAVIRLRSRVRTRAALLGIAAAGPIAGFLVAIVSVFIGLRDSTYTSVPVLHRVQAPLLFEIVHRLLRQPQPLELLVPHPILTASWIGILITALNLIPAGQLDGGHIVFAISPRAHRLSSRIVSLGLIALGVFSWVGWILWGLILLTPGMRHPRITDEAPVPPVLLALVPVCAVLFLLTAMYEPFQGYGLLTLLRKLPHRYH